MAAGTIPAPGTEYGPCTEACEHTDCQASRDVAESECRFCRKPIGYDRRYYFETGNDGRPAHAAELEDDLAARHRPAGT